MVDKARLSKLIHVEQNDVVKKNVYDELVKELNATQTIKH